MTKPFEEMSEWELGDNFAFRAPYPNPGKIPRSQWPCTVLEDLWAAMEEDPALKARVEGVIQRLRDGGRLQGGPPVFCFYCKMRRRKTLGRGKTSTGWATCPSSSTRVGTPDVSEST